MVGALVVRTPKIAIFKLYGPREAAPRPSKGNQSAGRLPGDFLSTLLNFQGDWMGGSATLALQLGGSGRQISQLGQGCSTRIMRNTPQNHFFRIPRPRAPRPRPTRGCRYILQVLWDFPNTLRNF